MHESKVGIYHLNSKDVQFCISQFQHKCIFISEGVTFRGCVSDVDQGIRDSCMNDTLGLACFICENAGLQACNGEVSGFSPNNSLSENFVFSLYFESLIIISVQIFPINRLRCHTCEENNLKGSCFSGLDGNAPVCKTYAPDDRCFTRRTGMNPILAYYSRGICVLHSFIELSVFFFLCQQNQLNEVACRMPRNVVM